MKKLLFVAVLGALVACGETASETPAADTATAAPVDTAAAAPVVDTTKVDTAAAAAVDTTKK